MHRYYVASEGCPPQRRQDVFARQEGENMVDVLSGERIPAATFHEWYQPYSGPGFVITAQGVRELEP